MIAKADTGARQGVRVSAPKWRSVMCIALVAGLIGGVAGAALASVMSSGDRSTVQITVVHGVAGPALAQGASIPAIVDKTLPSVVTITATGPPAGSAGGEPFVTEGTGMIVDTQGDVLTNNHVIAGSAEVSVTLHDQTQPLAAYVVAADATQDVALLRISDPPPGLVPVIFGDSSDLVVGDAVVAIGDALGLSAGTPTVSSGIVSALDRTVEAAQYATSATSSSQAGPALQGMIQTDAPVNPGNSGGPLLDSAGRVVGMNTAVVTSDADGTPARDIGFAIPCARLVESIVRLQKGAGTGKALLGVEAVSDTPELQSRYGLAVGEGAFVVAVDAGSPAGEAGLVPGDLIVGYDSRNVVSAAQLEDDVRSTRVGQRVELSLWRDKRRLSVSATLESSDVAP